MRRVAKAEAAGLAAAAEVFDSFVWPGGVCLDAQAPEGCTLWSYKWRSFSSLLYACERVCLCQTAVPQLLPGVGVG